MVLNTEEIYKNSLRDYVKQYGKDELEVLRDRYLDTIRLINEVLRES